MFKNNQIRNQQANVAKMVSAFACFKQRGAEIAQRRYPDLVSFFNEHKEKSIEQVEQELIQKLPAKVHN